MTYKKYFIAIVIPEPILSEIEILKQQLFIEHNLKGALRSPAHITIHRPFEWKEEKENLLTEKLKEFTFENKFEIALKDFSSFEPRVIYIDVIQNQLLNQLHFNFTQFAKQELKLFNEAEDRRGFQPHVTIAFRDLKKKLFYLLKEKFATQNFEGKFLCEKISLMKLEKKWEEIFYIN